jgi:hypothetical protein
MSANGTACHRTNRLLQRECELDPHFRSGDKEKCPMTRAKTIGIRAWIGDQVVTTDDERSHEQQECGLVFEYKCHLVSSQTPMHALAIVLSAHGSADGGVGEGVKGPRHQTSCRLLFPVSPCTWAELRIFLRSHTRRVTAFGASTGTALGRSGRSLPDIRRTT